VPVRAKTDRKGTAAQSQMSGTDRVRAQESERQSLVSIVNILRAHGPLTRLDLERETHLGRAVVLDRLATLSSFGLIDEAGIGRSIGGRAPRLVRFRTEAACMLVANIDGVTIGVGLSDLKGQLILEHYEDLDSNASADANFARLEELFDWFLTQNGGTLWAIGLGVPGAVEAAAGPAAEQRLGMPKVGTMPPWNDVLPFRKLMHRFKVPMWVRSAVQMEAMGEVTRLNSDSRREVLFVDLGTEIGVGLVLDGRIHQGVQGTAGQLGHIYIGEGYDKICGCGNVGCLQTVAGCEAVAFEGLLAARDGRSRPLREVLERTGTVTVSDIGNASRLGDPFASDLLAQCGRLIGMVLASAVNLLNPSIVVIGGELAQTGDICLAAIREGIYGHAQPLVTREISIVRSRMGRSAGLVGAATVAVDEIFAPNFMEKWITLGSPIAHPQLDDLFTEVEPIIGV
jgi:predicted NBD/HSP70 family sugar kinase